MVVRSRVACRLVDSCFQLYCLRLLLVVLPLLTNLLQVHACVRACARALACPMSSRMLWVLRHSQPPQQGRKVYRSTLPPAPVLGGGGTRAQASCLPAHLLVMSFLVAVMCFRIFFRTVRTITISVSGIAPRLHRA